MDNRLPKGPGFYQERYLAAFNGLTQMYASGAMKWGGPILTTHQRRWLDMFEQLTATDEVDEGVPAD